MPSEICGFLKEELDVASTSRVSGKAISQSIEPRSCTSSYADVLRRSDDAVRGMQCRFRHSDFLAGTLRHGKSWQWGLDPERVTMIRPICVALAISSLSAPAFAETCIASHYGYGGGRTASGERMNPSAMTAAHRARPFGSHVTVTSHSTGRSVTVRINDRGPFVKGRCIDLSTGAARVLGFSGTAMVSLD